MGKRLLEYYDKAKKIGGVKAKMRLIMLTLMPTPEASKAPDSPENIRKFEMAIKKLEKTFRR